MRFPEWTFGTSYINFSDRLVETYILRGAQILLLEGYYE